METAKQKNHDYLWVMLILCFITYAICFGFCSSGRTLYLTAITDAFGFRRGDFALTDTFRYVTSIIVNLFFGFLIHKYKAKTLLCFGIVFMLSFAVINTFAQDLWLFYLGSICLGIGAPLTGTTMMSVVINRWATKNKGIIMGIVLSANGLGGALAAQIVTPIIFEEGNPLGFRNSYRLISMILCIIIVLVIIFFREYPKNAQKTYEPLKKNKKARSSVWVGIDYEQAIKKPYFYITMMCVAFIGFSLTGLNSISVPYMYDIGFAKDFVANITTMTSLFLMATKAFTGLFYDKFGIKITMNICFASCFISIIGFFLLKNSVLGMSVAVVRAFFSSVAQPLETIMISFFIAELFGNKAFDKIVGPFIAACNLGLAIGSPLSNYCFDFFGNYYIPIIMYALLMAFVIIAMNIVIKEANRDKQKILQALAESGQA